MDKDSGREAAASTASPEISLTDPVFLAELRTQMVKFARNQLSDEHLAEDAVQEALIGALKNVGSFQRKAALKTWVFSILKFKITDILRQRQRVLVTSELVDEDDNAEAFSDTLFKPNGHWHKHERPTSWQGPQSGVYSAHFWRLFETCLTGLPEKQARVFMMREFLELESAEICQTAGLSISNLHVILYRARLRLRECLENTWFDNEQQQVNSGSKSGGLIEENNRK